MNLKNKKPVLIPLEFQGEIEKLSKAALMDMVWDYAYQFSGGALIDKGMEEFRTRREIILQHRK